MSVEINIRSNPYEAYRGISHVDKKEVFIDRNVGFTVGSQDQQIKEQFFSAAEEFGFISIDTASIYNVLAFLFKRDGVVISDKKSAKKQTGKIVAHELSQLQFDISDHKFRIFEKNNDAGQVDLIDIAKEYFLEHQEEADIAVGLSRNEAVVGKVIKELKAFIVSKTGLAIVQADPNQFLEEGIKLLVGSGADTVKADIRRKTDRVINSSDQSVYRLGLAREIVYQDALEAQRSQLRESIDTGAIQLTPSFDLFSLPRDALMVNLKEGVKAEIAKFMASEGFTCDPQDLRYQTLFRLTTFPVSDLFEDGDHLNSYLHETGAYLDWKNIINLDQNVINGYAINLNLVARVISEQAAIIDANMKRSELPVCDILTPSGIFSESGWVIQRAGGQVYAVLEEGVTSASDRVKLRFEEVDLGMANKFHQDLHYIHTPRAIIAFGMYVEDDDELPFSVLALDKVDRNYKKNVLLMNGYDPRKCLDLTRLYSRPGTPGNTSSSMFKLAFSYIRENLPETEAILSSFMPSYASGISMISGGFRDTVLVKPLSHIFTEREVGNGQTAYEFVTNRRVENEDVLKINTKIPLLPTMELIAPLKSPRYEPLFDSTKYMVEVT